jgi:hypothetical protein
MMNYFICGNRLLAFNAKCATSSFSWAILRQYHPEVVEQLKKDQWANGQSVENQMLHRWVPKRFSSRGFMVAQIVREPVERFRSAYGFMGLGKRIGSVDAVLDDLINETHALDSIRGTIASNIHFRPQNRFDGDITFFRMDQLQDCADFLGIEVPLTRINQTKVEKPILTLAQEKTIRDYYAEDVDLWDSLQESNKKEMAWL